jgi:hypothetical protein
VRLHVMQDIVQHPDRPDNMRPLIEHHAFGPHSHRGVGDFRTTRSTPCYSPLTELALLRLVPRSR